MSDSPTPPSDTPDPEAPPAAEIDASAVPAPWSIALPHITTGLAPDEVDARVEKMALRGKLAGYARTPAGFDADAFGALYDRALHATVAKTESGCELRFTSSLKKRWPALVIAAMAFAIWPGVIFTDSLLATWFGWYRLSIWWTSAWYIPLTLLALPVLWKQFKGSEVASWIHAHEVIDALGERLDGEVHAVEY